MYAIIDEQRKCFRQCRCPVCRKCISSKQEHFAADERHRMWALVYMLWHSIKEPGNCSPSERVRASARLRELYAAFDTKSVQ